MEDIKLKADVREGKSTKKDLSSRRANAQVPGVVYGGSQPPVKVALSEKDLLAARKKGGKNAILHIEVGGKTETVIVKELQRHPVTDRPVHADFQRISLTEKITAKVPLRIVGEAPGVKTEGGVMQHELRELSVRALPTKIPQHIDVDVSGLALNGHLSVKDLKVAGDIEVLDSADHLVVHITAVKVEAEPEAAAAAAPAEGAAAPAEPESSSTKGKKDEEGKLVKETAKPAAAAAEKKEPAKK